jgi:hypothetical protein
VAQVTEELTVAEEDGIKRGEEDGAGVHDPLDLPPLTLGRRRLPLPRWPGAQIRLVAPIKNCVLVPAAAEGLSHEEEARQSGEEAAAATEELHRRKRRSRRQKLGAKPWRRRDLRPGTRARLVLDGDRVPGVRRRVFLPGRNTSLPA